MTALTPRAEAVVDLDAIRSSVASLAEHARGAELMAIVKADGYGHGSVESARAALAGGASWLGVAYIEEALQLRTAGIDVPLLVLVEPQPGAAELALSNQVDLAVGSLVSLDLVSDAARAAATTARVHLKVDTGLSRGGSPVAGWPALVAAAAQRQSAGLIEVVGVWSHLAYADDPTHPSIDRQAAAFREALEVAEQAGVRPQLRHLANSAATIARPDLHYDLVRPGIACYGLSPVPSYNGSLSFVPAMTLRARVALTKRLPAGSGISYGHRYTTATEVTTALVPLGYADGVPRAATNIAEVLIGGRRKRISGTVCMDQFVVDVGDDSVHTGDDVLLFGPGDRGEPTAQEWADALGTIHYEIVTRVGARVPRRYVGGA